MSFFKHILGSRMVVDVMVGICVHDPDILLQPPSNVKDTAMKSLSAAIKNASLSSSAKTAYLITQGAMNFKESEEEASKDLPEQIKLFMNKNGFDQNKYDIQTFSEDLRNEIKVLWAVAIRR